MANLKDYRDKELRYYLIANIGILLLLLDFFQLSHSESNMKTLEIISNVLNLSILSSTIYVLTFIADSIFSSKLKDFLIFNRIPGSKIFSKIQEGNYDIRILKEDALRIYINIYNSLPEKKKERYNYENAEWYKIYNKYREVPMIFSSNRDALLCRDIYFSTIMIIIIYLTLTIAFEIITFDYRYIIYLITMLLISNIGTRIKRARFVSNVIVHDIANNKGE